MRKVFTLHWILGHLLALSLITIFIIAGFWQLDRLEQRRVANNLLQGRYAQTAVTAADVAGESGTELDFRQSSISGVYELDSELLLRSRSYNGEAGWHVLTPLRLDGGQLLLINRGWVPYAMNTAPVSAAAPPAGRVQLTGVLHPAEIQPTGFWAGLVPKDPPAGKLNAAYYVNLPRLSAQLPGLLQAQYLQLNTQSPTQAGDLPIPAAEAVLTEGPHFSYALQWFSFALIGIVGYVFLMRRVISSDEPMPSTAQAPGKQAA